MRFARCFVLTLLASLTVHGATLDAAKALYHERKDAEAKSAFTALAQSEPRNAEVHFYLGRLANRAREVDAAVKHFEKAVELAPTNSNYHLDLGGAYGQKAMSANLFSKASLAGKSRTAMEKAVELDPRNLEARQGLMQFYQQAPSIMGGGLDKAHAQADEIMKLDVQRGRVAKSLLFVREKQFDAAFALWEEALQQTPDHYGALYQLGRIAAESGQQLDRGLAALERCLKMSPSENDPGHAAAHWRIGNIHEKRGDKTAARAAYDAALTVDAKFQPAIDALKRL